MTPDEKKRFKESFWLELDGYINQTATHIVEIAELIDAKPSLIMQVLSLAVQTKFYKKRSKDDRNAK